MKYSWLLVVLMLLTLNISETRGASTIREVKKTIRNARYHDNAGEAKKISDGLYAAEKSLIELLGSTTDQKKRAEIYYVAAQVYSRLNDIENAKIYLKKPYDTLTFYNSICKVYEYLNSCDSVESIHNKFKYRAKSRKILLSYRNNLLSGGRYYMQHKKFDVAFRIFDTYLTSAMYPMLQQDKLQQKAPIFSKIAYWTVCSAFLSHDYNGVVKHTPQALGYINKRPEIQEYYCRALESLNETDKWVSELKKGLKEYPDHDYFFATLMAYFSDVKKYNEALFYTDKMIQHNPLNWHYWFVKAQIHLCKEEYNETIAACNKVIQLQPKNVDAHYYLGLSYCNLAKLSTELMKSVPLNSDLYKKYKSDMILNYNHAEEPLLFVKTSKLEQPSLWAPLLYQVYLNLNKGKEFDEMDRIIKSANYK